MNTSSSDRFAPEPLTPEERAMAMRLARIGPHGEPSPALDAHIIGAAHAATGSSRSATHWPALIGLAATLALAVGITWQLKPVGEPAVDGTVQETASAPAAEVMTAPADMPQQQSVPDPQQTPAPSASRDATTERLAPKASVTPAPTRSAGTTLADPVPTRSAPSPPAPPPPAPAAPSVAAPAVIASDNAEAIMRGT
ncbi:MAG: hypothetical protein M3414_08425, partial [Pseudomonadota bacterium]|nr:hypothetical protein [Pseudomonadota bacterium]